jgi:flagellar biogenesis protein FliO
MELWESIVRMASALGVVLALILGLLAVLRSRVGRRFLVVDGSQLVTVLGSGAIGPRKQIVVLAVAGEVLIVGTTPTDIVSLGRISDSSKVATLLTGSGNERTAAAVGPFTRTATRQEASHAG